jgi:hypothetical protein
MTLSFKEKKELAINLIEQGVPTREIARQTHLSYSTIGKIRKELEGDTSENNKKPLSISSQSFKLFEKHKTLIQVAIKLDLPSDEVLKIRSQYLTLQNNQKVEFILRENRNNLNLFLKLFNLLKEKKVEVNDLIFKFDLENDRKNLISKKEDLKFEIDILTYHHKYLQIEINRKNNEFYYLKKC